MNQRAGAWRDGLVLAIILFLVAILFTGFSNMSPKEQEQLIWFFILTGSASP